MTTPRENLIAWPASAMLTGNGIALILRVPGTEHGDWWSLRGRWVFVGCGALVMASKYLVQVNGRRVFNPSNFALVATFLVLSDTRVDPQIHWSGPFSFGLVLAFIVTFAAGGCTRLRTMRPLLFTTIGAQAALAAGAVSFSTPFLAIAGDARPATAADAARATSGIATRRRLVRAAVMRLGCIVV